MIQSVDITIHQDWNKVRKLYESVLAMKAANRLKQEDFHIKHGASQYHVGDLGTLWYEDLDYTSKDWGSLTGKIIHKQLSWIDQAYQIFAGLHFYGCSWNVTHTDIRPHRDPPSIDIETGLPAVKVLYMITSEDTDAVTLSYDNNDPTMIYSHKSVPGTAFLLDPYSLHELKSKGLREILEFRFYNEYDTLAKFFDQAGPIVFGNPLNNTL